MSNYLNGGAWRSRFHFEVVSDLSSLRNYFPDFPELFYLEYTTPQSKFRLCLLSRPKLVDTTTGLFGLLPPACPPAWVPQLSDRLTIRQAADAQSDDGLKAWEDRVTFKRPS